MALWCDPRITTALMLCDMRGRFLFEVLPDVFPPMLTTTEMALWGKYYDAKSRDRR